MTPIPHWRRNINLFLGGQFLSGITTMIVQYAIIWYLTKQTGSATILSYATLVGMLPMVLLSPFVGGFIDRARKKRLLILSDWVVAAFALALFAVGHDRFPLWLVFVSLAARAIAQTFQMPTIQSLIPTLVPEDELTRINGQLGMVQSANMLIAPALGAFLFSVVDIRWLILLDVLGALLGTLMLWPVRIPHRPASGGDARVWQDTKAGFTMLRNRRGLWAMTVLGMAFTLVFMPAASLYPLMTMQHFHGSVGQAGLIEVVYSAGMLAGGTIIGLFGHWRDRMRPITLSYLIIGVTIGASGLLPGTRQAFWWFVALNALAGIGTPFFNTLLMAMIQQSFPPERLGRVLGVLNALMSLTGPVGLLFAGPLADWLGVAPLFVIAGVGTLICGAVTWLLPSTRTYDLRLQAEAAEKKD
ncbi:MFS transporter [Lacticaseibacillus kribbianus]|uniref:MFS transporter n=1 Tax=Lacticaseibacillus kribbianus TaxID=2926292 RepID=UPI001CD47D6B|nr:MFS transporter [Lacticaseibacillus kribbianus]